MAFWEWQETYLLDISTIDHHHRKLVALVNSLYVDVFECKDNSQKHQAVGRSLAEFIDYSHYHFALEEELMQKYKYPGYEGHKEEHNQFRLEVTRLMTQYKEGTLILSLPIFQFLKGWISIHILETDKKYVPYIPQEKTPAY